MQWYGIRLDLNSEYTLRPTSIHYDASWEQWPIVNYNGLHGNIPQRVLFNEGFARLANDLLDPHAVPLALFPGCTAGKEVT